MRSSRRWRASSCACPTWSARVSTVASRFVPPLDGIVRNRHHPLDGGRRELQRCPLKIRGIKIHRGQIVQIGDSQQHRRPQPHVPVGLNNRLKRLHADLRRLEHEVDYSGRPAQQQLDGAEHRPRVDRLAAGWLGPRDLVESNEPQIERKPLVEARVEVLVGVVVSVDEPGCDHGCAGVKHPRIRRDVRLDGGYAPVAQEHIGALEPPVGPQDSPPRSSSSSMAMRAYRSGPTSWPEPLRQSRSTRPDQRRRE